jgi:type I restriction enzyme S subunit
MSFPGYERYKDAGLQRLPHIPAHWEALKLKRVVRIRYGIGEPPAYREEGTPLVRATNVDSGRITYKDLVLVDPADIPEKRIVWLSPGDIIVVRSGAYTGDSAIIRPHHCPCIAGFDMVVTPRWCLPDFLQYALLSPYLKRDQIDLEKLRAAQPHLNAEELGDCIFLLPPEDEQHGIAAFLDHETAKIDALVEEQRRLIELLKEKRQAVISHAVTKGLDPNARMKDSAVEWLGQVPEHWDLGKFSREVRVAEGQVDPEIEPFASMPLIAPNHVQSRTGVLLAMETASEQGAISGKYMCKSGDVIYSKIRPA